MDDKKTDAEKLVILSAGGTGGHVMPAAALSRDLIARGYRVELITDKRGFKYANSFGDIPVHVVPAGTVITGFLGKISGAARLATGLVKAGALLRRLRPSIVVGFGGYPSVPAVLAAQRRGIPTVIHEQNAILGRANDFLADRAVRIALSLPYIEGLEKSHLSRAVVTGNPVREDIAILCTRPYPILDQQGPLRIFVVGGSLGARIFSDIVPEALTTLPLEQRARLDITQQCRAEDIERVRTVYSRAGIHARLETFFTDIPDILAKTHLVISRSGASTVAEITVAGRPAIFVPAGYHADQQQKINAQTVADAGGAWVMPQDGFTVDALQAQLKDFLRSPELLFRAAEAARGCGRPDAARRLGNLVTEIASGWESGHRR